MPFMPWLIALIFLAIDQLSKWLIVEHFQVGQSYWVLFPLLQWVYVQNTRGAYGLFGNHPWFLILIALMAFVAIWLAFRQRAKSSPTLAIALGVVLGGAVGNIVDRLHYGFVVDFIRIVPLAIFEVFNIADAGISLGILTIVLVSLQSERDLQ